MKLNTILLTGFLALPLAVYAGAKFIDSDTLEVTAKGKARKAASATQTESGCKEAARNEALRIAIETLVDMNWPNVKGKVTRKKYGEQVTQATEGSIKGAHVVSSQVDDSTDPVTCAVTLRIERMNAASTHRSVMQSLDAEEQAERKLRGKAPRK